MPMKSQICEGQLFPLSELLTVAKTAGKQLLSPPAAASLDRNHVRLQRKPTNKQTNKQSKSRFAALETVLGVKE